ncbi:hypothetical protein V8E53_005753, partial [Lactarius tabidus]
MLSGHVEEKAKALEGCTTGTALRCNSWKIRRWTLIGVVENGRSGNRTAREARVKPVAEHRLEESSSSRKAISEPLMHRLSLQLYLWVLSRLSGAIQLAISRISTNGQGAQRKTSVRMVATVYCAAISSPSFASQVGPVKHSWALVYRYGLIGEADETQVVRVGETEEGMGVGTVDGVVLTDEVTVGRVGLHFPFQLHSHFTRAYSTGYRPTFVPFVIPFTPNALSQQEHGFIADITRAPHCPERPLPSDASRTSCTTWQYTQQKKGVVEPSPLSSEDENHANIGDPHSRERDELRPLDARCFPPSREPHKEPVPPRNAFRRSWFFLSPFGGPRKERCSIWRTSPPCDAIQTMRQSKNGSANANVVPHRKGKARMEDNWGSKKLMYVLKNALEDNWCGLGSTNTGPREKKRTKLANEVGDNEDEKEERTYFPTSLDRALATACAYDLMNPNAQVPPSTSGSTRRNFECQRDLGDYYHVDDETPSYACACTGGFEPEQRSLARVAPTPKRRRVTYGGDLSEEHKEKDDSGDEAPLFEPSSTMRQSHHLPCPVHIPVYIHAHVLPTPEQPSSPDINSFVGMPSAILPAPARREIVLQQYVKPFISRRFTTHLHDCFRVAIRASPKNISRTANQSHLFLLLCDRRCKSNAPDSATGERNGAFQKTLTELAQYRERSPLIRCNRWWLGYWLELFKAKETDWLVPAAIRDHAACNRCHLPDLYKWAAVLGIPEDDVSQMVMCKVRYAVDCGSEMDEVSKLVAQTGKAAKVMDADHEHAQLQPSTEFQRNTLNSSAGEDTCSYAHVASASSSVSPSPFAVPSRASTSNPREETVHQRDAAVINTADKGNNGPLSREDESSLANSGDPTPPEESTSGNVEMPV